MTTAPGTRTPPTKQDLLTAVRPLAIDVGIPLLSMHSARELAGTEDPINLTRAMESFLAGD